jgi:hypothetical protein
MDPVRNPYSPGAGRPPAALDWQPGGSDVPARVQVFEGGVRAAGRHSRMMSSAVLSCSAAQSLSPVAALMVLKRVVAVMVPLTPDKQTRVRWLRSV